MPPIPSCKLRVTEQEPPLVARLLGNHRWDCRKFLANLFPIGPVFTLEKKKFYVMRSVEKENVNKLRRCLPQL